MANSWQCFFEQNYYTAEQTAQLVLIPSPEWRGLEVAVSINGVAGVNIQKQVLLAEQHIFAVPIGLLRGRSHIKVILRANGAQEEQMVELLKLPPKSNAVKINKLQHSLIVDELPYFPLGFYCYSPVQSSLAEEEVVKGFNLLSPYQLIEAHTFADRKRYLDRCAELGMKVHYNLLSIAGGGGPRQGRSSMDRQQKMDLLRQEIMAVKDHPALLAWYISDEPTGQNIAPETLLESYQLIKQLDPYHPISIVFMNPKEAHRYEQVMDIAMVDPYPIPNRSPEEVGSITQSLVERFRYQKPVWLVPQAFGGNEHWAREPSPREIQLMTWLGVINGATGIQYFIRHGLSSFPKSSLTWDAASSTVKELTDLTPFLLQPEGQGKLPILDKQLEARWYKKNGQLIVVILNTINKPKNFILDLASLKLPSETAVLFEDRQLELNGTRLQDIIDGYGRRVYLFDVEKMPGERTSSRNLILDPSFENSLVPGTPSACYIKLRGDRGAQASLDTRMSIHGRQSLKLVTPSYDQGVDVSLFPVQLEKGQSYAISFWARSLQESARFSVQVGFGAQKNFNLSALWKKYTWVFSSSGNEATRNQKTSIILSLIDAGSAWVDLVQLTTDPLIEYENQPFAKETTVAIRSAKAQENGAVLQYTLDGSRPGPNAPRYKGPFKVNRTAIVSASVQQGGQRWTNSETVFVNINRAQKVRYTNPFHPTFSAGGANGLIDGIKGSPRFTDGNWQGWNSGNIDIVLDFGSEVSMKKVFLNFLKDHPNWIYLPQKIEVYGSRNGKRFHKIGTQSLGGSSFDPVAQTSPMSMVLDGKKYRFLKIVGQRLSAMPADHPSSGGNPFVFLDEILVER